MKTDAFNIGPTPALLIGEKCDKIFLFVHGLHGRKEEALDFAEVAVPKGYQVIGVDLPVERKPWEVMPLLKEVRDHLYHNWKSVSIRTNSKPCPSAPTALAHGSRCWHFKERK